MSHSASKGWREMHLGDALTFQRGFDITKKEQREGPYPVISSSGPNSTHAKAKASGPGVVIGRKGTLGRVFFVGTDYWPHDTTLWIKDFHDNDERFAYYFLQTMGLEQYDSGASNPTLNRNHIHLLPVRYPPLPVQRRIAEILSAYDDLIENNTRRIAILEEITRAIFREWFVEFRFPGHEQVGIVGSVPEGWEVMPIGETVTTLGGGTPSTKKSEYWDGGDVTWFSPSDLTSAGTMYISDSAKKINEDGLLKSSAKLFPPYSVMMTSRATIGVTAINTAEACTNQGFITCIPTERLPALYLYFWIELNKERIITLASGATFKEINKTTFRELPVTVPAQPVADAFRETTEPIGRLIERLQRSNGKLRETRDLLLPKLISGDIDVSEAEEELETAAA